MASFKWVALAAALCVLLCLVAEADAHKKHHNKKARGLIVPMRKHRAQHHRVGLRATRDNADKNAQMLVNDLDTYSVEVNIGTPAQKFLLNIDTGSNDLLVYGPTCPKENCPGAPYDQRASNSYIDVSCTSNEPQPSSGLKCNCSNSVCNYNAAYGDGSFANGRVSRDRIVVGDLNQYTVETFFGQITVAGGSTLESEAFYTNSTLSGILGLAPTGAGSAYNRRSAVLDLCDQYDLPLGFTICLRPYVGGALVIGEDYSDTTVATYSWTKQTLDSMYTVKLNDVTIGQTADETTSLGLSGANVLLDSATTNIIFPESTEVSVKNALKSFCPGLKGICDGTGASIWNNWIQLTEDELIAYPDLYFKIDGVYKTLRLTPVMYMTEFNGYYILNLDFLGNDIILGNGFMKNFRIGFDVENKRIGFADLASCPGDNDIQELVTSPNNYKVDGNAMPIGLVFDNPSAYQYSWFCGWDAKDIACSTTEPPCRTSAATEPSFQVECPADWNYAIGKDVAYQARWGRALSVASGQAGIGMDENVVTAVPPFTTPFVFGQFKYYNAPVEKSTYIERIIVRANTKFLRNVSVDTVFAEFEYDFHLKVTNFDVCQDLGCPWNDPNVNDNWPEQFINDECIQMENGDYRLVDSRGPLCCPYYTSRNDFNQCSDLVELTDDGIADNDFVTVQGEIYKVMLTGFHAAVGGHRGRGLVPAFAADFNTLTRVNIHAQLIDLCPDCPPGTRQIKNDDGSCTCACQQTCNLPLASEPDCSCVARVSHSHCAGECTAEDAAAIGCDLQYGEIYTAVWAVHDFGATAQEICGCRCVRGCPAGFRQTAKCACVCDCDANAPPPPGIDTQHSQCNKWVCNDNGIGCKYIADGGSVCSKYNWPLGAPKDPQCWAPKCVAAGGHAECQGMPADVNPGACPVPAGVSPYCYVKKCDGVGKCSLEYITSTGGKDAGSPHLGSCPVPAGMDARCYWPYCDSTGNCAGDVFTGLPYTAAGDWKDGTMGTRPGQPGCTVAELTDAGNAKYGKFNPDCFIARCDGGKCGGDAVNYGQPCAPIDGRVTGGYNEVFIGAAWPGMSEDCVYYECGTAPGERGHCIQKALPGNRVTPCHNSDNDLCTLDFCDGLGMCKDHEWIQGHHPEGVCVTSTCNPATGEWTFARNGDACCDNSVINLGEECEVGVNGADAQCCVDCYLQSKCDDKNACTADTCVDGHCVSTLDLSFSSKCEPLDTTLPDNRCKLIACSAESGKCEAMPDPTKEGVECDGDTDQCNHHVCRAGRCTAEEDNTGTACSLPTAATPDLTCKSLQCVARDGKGYCEPVNDNSKVCDDKNACTSDSCVEGACVSTPSVACPAPVNDCYAPGVCDPATGSCSSAVLPDGTACAKPADASAPAQDACTDYVCAAGVCTRSDTGVCQCGNGKLDDGEECDWSLAAQKDCCSADCKGCICGNGKLDEGEQCDFNIPSQLECCSKECQGCLCGNGVLDEGEACDPVLAEKNGECCNPDCTPCAVLARSSSIALPVGAAVAGLVAAFALAAFVAARSASQAAVSGAGPGAAAVSQSVNNPAYVGAASNNNPLYTSMGAN